MMKGGHGQINQLQDIHVALIEVHVNLGFTPPPTAKKSKLTLKGVAYTTMLFPLAQTIRNICTYLGVTVLDSNGAGVILGSLVEQLHAVLLGGEGRGKMDRDHLQHGVSSREPFPHHRLHRGKII